MKLPFETIKFKFGKYKGICIKDAPDNYLHFLYNKNILQGKMLYYYQVKFNLPMKSFTITIQDAIIGNGTYTVKAYNKKHALGVCFKEHNIQCTQSYDGTTISVH